MLDESRMIEKGILGIQKILDVLLHCAYLFPKNAINREGIDNTQTSTVTVAEKAAINGYERINRISKATVPAVMGLLRLGIIELDN